MSHTLAHRVQEKEERDRQAATGERPTPAPSTPAPSTAAPTPAPGVSTLAERVSQKEQGEPQVVQQPTAPPAPPISLTPEQIQTMRRIELMGRAPEDSGIPPMALPPGVAPIERITDPEFHLTTPTRMPFLTLVDMPGETGAELFAQVPKIATGRFGEVEAPTAFTGGLYDLAGVREATEQFQDRPMWQQLLLGAIFDPLGPAIGAGAVRTALGGLRRLAGRGARQALEPDVIKRMIDDIRTEITKGADPDVITRTTDEAIEAYVARGGDRNVLRRMMEEAERGVDTLVKEADRAQAAARRAARGVGKEELGDWRAAWEGARRPGQYQSFPVRPRLGGPPAQPSIVPEVAGEVAGEVAPRPPVGVPTGRRIFEERRTPQLITQPGVVVEPVPSPLIRAASGSEPRIIVPDDPAQYGERIVNNRVQQPNGEVVRGTPLSADDAIIPDEIYHVTTNAPAVRSSGMLKASGEGGLGGSPRDQIVSFTIDKEIATQLAEDLKLASEISRLDVGEVRTLKRLEASKRITARLLQQMTEEGWDSEGFRRITSSEISQTTYNSHDWLGQYFTFRASATTPAKRNPLFFTGAERLRRINPNDVDVIAVPKRSLRTGAMLTNLDLDNPYGLREIRLYGDVPVKPADAPIPTVDEVAGRTVVQVDADIARYERLAAREYTGRTAASARRHAVKRAEYEQRLTGLYKERNEMLGRPAMWSSAAAMARRYRQAKGAVDGRTIRNPSEIPNEDSIAATLDDWDELPGLREVPLYDFELTGRWYSAEGSERIRALQLEIQASDEISPLIVVIDDEGPYILEGATRAEALYNLDAKTFPAKVVIDRRRLPRVEGPEVPEALAPSLAPAVPSLPSSMRRRIAGVSGIRPTPAGEPRPSLIETVPGVPELTSAGIVARPKPRPSNVPLTGDTAREAALLEDQVAAYGINQASEVSDVSRALDEGDAVAERLAGGAPPRPRKPGQATGADMPPPERSEWALQDELETLSWEKMEEAVLRKWSGARNVQGIRMTKFMEEGNRLLKRYGLKSDAETMEPLYEVLHGERALSELSEDMQRVHAYVIELRNLEEREMLEFLAQAGDDPALRGIMAMDVNLLANKMMAHPDYFPRNWKEPPSFLRGRGQVGPARGALGARPGETRPRVDATFQEMRAEGWEPASWNPVAMMGRRRMSGIEYRESVVMINHLKRESKALPLQQLQEWHIDQGWRVPSVGPAFEGRPFPKPDGDVGRTAALAVPKDVANVLEGIYGRPSEISFLDEATKWSGRVKRIKLVGSLFQHFDFFGRAIGTAMTPTGIMRGAPLRLPSLAWRITRAQLMPGVRRTIRDRIVSDEAFAIHNGVPITRLMVVEEGLGVQGDISIVKREFGQALEDLERQGGVTKALTQAREYFEAGLFDGVYRETIDWSLENFIIPWIRRTRPNATARQIAAEAAESANIMFSTMERWQSMLKNPTFRKAMQVAIFSTNESEGLMRGAARAVSTRPQAGMFREWYLGLFLGLAGVANIINYAATAIAAKDPTKGEFLPASSYSPIKLNDPHAPFKIGYNNKFLSPQVPGLTGKIGNPLTLDIVGQMDTAFRWVFDPGGAVAARTNVLPRAFWNQFKGETFFGESLDESIDDQLRREYRNFDAMNIDRKDQLREEREGRMFPPISLRSFIKRATQAGIDVVLPITGMGGLQALSQAVPAVREAGVYESGEEALGLGGQLLQTSGINVRAENIRAMLRREHPNFDEYSRKRQKSLRAEMIDRVYGE